MSTSFNLIPNVFRTPGTHVEFDASRAVRGLSGQPHRILVIGTRQAAGTVAQLLVKRILSAAQAEEYFGRGSMLSGMVSAAKAANPLTEMNAIALDAKVGGTAAEGLLAFTGPSTKAGTLVLYIGGRRIPVAVAAGASAATVATASAAAVNALTDLPVTATAADNEVTITCRWKGLTGNKIDLRVNYYENEMLPVGIGVTVTAMADGATDPDLADVIAVLGDTQYDTIIVPYADATNLTALETELDRRWGPMVQAAGHAFIGACDTHGNLTTLGNARNSKNTTIMGGGPSPTPPWIWAAVTGAVDAGEPDPARPRQTLALPGLLPPTEKQRFTRAERDLLLSDGISTFTVDPAGLVLIERLITTYQVNASSIADTSYLDVTTIRTLLYLRYSVRARIAQRYPRHKLASDGTRFDPGQAVVTPKDIRAELLSLFQLWERAALVEGFEQFKRELIVERNETDPNRVDALVPPDLVNQFLGLAVSVQFSL